MSRRIGGRVVAVAAFVLLLVIAGSTLRTGSSESPILSESSVVSAAYNVTAGLKPFESDDADWFGETLRSGRWCRLPDAETAHGLGRAWAVVRLSFFTRFPGPPVQLFQIRFSGGEVISCGIGGDDDRVWLVDMSNPSKAVRYHVDVGSRAAELRRRLAAIAAGGEAELGGESRGDVVQPVSDGQVPVAEKQP